MRVRRSPRAIGPSSDQTSARPSGQTSPPPEQPSGQSSAQSLGQSCQPPDRSLGQSSGPPERSSGQPSGRLSGQTASPPFGLTRRDFLVGAALAGAAGASSLLARRSAGSVRPREPVFLARVREYSVDLRTILLDGLAQLGVGPAEVRGRRVLIKPNLVEPHAGRGHVNVHPLLVQAVTEAFRVLGAAGVVVAEGAGHRRDTVLVLEESGLADVLFEDSTPFVDLNHDETFMAANVGGRSRLDRLFLPKSLLRADLVVSLAKMKTHHWAGVTLSMKNLFGLMPGSVYGWPKNVLHWAGIDGVIFDINSALLRTGPPHLAVIDGVVGMEGDGPIMGTPVPAGVLVMGRSFPAADAAACRVMGVDPYRVPHLALADGRLGPIAEEAAEQRGEAVAALRRDFALLDRIPAQRGLRLAHPTSG